MNTVQQEIQHSRVMTVHRHISRAMNAAYELGKANALQGYAQTDNPFPNEPAASRAWENGWRDNRREGGVS